MFGNRNEEQPEARNLVLIIALNTRWLMEELSFTVEDEDEEEPVWVRGVEFSNADPDIKQPPMLSTPMSDVAIEALTYYNFTPASYLQDKETARINREELDITQKPIPLISDEEYINFDLEVCEHYWFGHVECVRGEQVCPYSPKEA